MPEHLICAAAAFSCFAALAVVPANNKVAAAVAKATLDNFFT